MVVALPEPGTLRSRALALGLVALLLAAVVRFVGMPLWQLYQRNVEAIEEQRYQLERYRRVAATLDAARQTLKRLLADDPIARYAIEEESAALAAATVQEQVKELVVQSGGKLTSARVLPTTAIGPFAQITVNVRLTLGNEALQRVLYGLESSTPLLVVDQLVITAQQVRRTGRLRRGNAASLPDPTDLDVYFNVSGLMRSTDSGRAAQS